MKPNIVLLIMDCARAKHLSCYGYHRETTPNIDRFAQDARLFEQAIAASSWSLPSHASLFTGLYPSSHNAVHRYDALPQNAQTLAAVLGNHGYQTAAVTTNSYINHASGLAYGFDELIEVWRTERRTGATRKPAWKRLMKRVAGSAPLREMQRRLALMQRYRGHHVPAGARRTHGQAMEWLADRRDRERPFFLFINDMDCHQPYAPPPAHLQPFLPAGRSAWRITGVNQDWEKLFVGAEKMSDEDLAIQKALYDGSLHYLDEQIGVLIEFLETEGLLDNTLLILTSDHGEGLGDHNDLEHGISLYDTLVHVPLIARLPGVFAGGTRFRDQVQLHDLFPTLLQLADVPLDELDLVDSRTLFESDGRKYAFSELAARSRKWAAVRSRYPGFDTEPHDVELKAVRTLDYKYIRRGNGVEELYHLTTDPGEIRNIAVEEGFRLPEFRDELRRFGDRTAARTFDVAQAVHDDETMTRLRDLGYVE